MKNTDIFDVLVVYSHGIASSASSVKQYITPFSHDFSRAHYDNAYSYLLEQCEKNGLTAAFTTSADIIGAGKCSSYWIFSNAAWKKINNPCYSLLIYNKFSPFTKTQTENTELLFSDQNVQRFSDKYLHALFFDKHKTYETLQEFSIPTVIIENGSKKSINRACLQLNQLVADHPNHIDFSSEYILKDRYGAEGNDIYKLGKNASNDIVTIMRQNPHVSFVIQPFTKFDTGYSYQNTSLPTDIRIIYHEEKIIQTYVRTAKKGDFRCNEHQGATLTYTSIKDIPKQVRIFSDNIMRLLNKKQALYALDFIVSNNGNIYLLEGNIGPGIDWNLSSKENEKMAKKLINIIVGGLKSRTQVVTAKILPLNISTPPTFPTVPNFTFYKPEVV